MLINLLELPPGLYQLVGPDEVKTIDVKANVYEGIHTWKDRVSGMQCLNGDGLRTLAGKVGINLVSRIVTDANGYTLAEAIGSIIWPDGTLEIYSSSKDYDLHAKLFQAGVKKAKEAGNARDEHNQPLHQTPGLVVQKATEETALAVVRELPRYMQIEIMDAQLEIREHRRALTTSKAENRVLRYFLRKCGVAMKMPSDFKKVEYNLQRSMINRKLTQADFEALSGDLFPPAAGPAASPASPTPFGEENTIEAEFETGEEADTVHEENIDTGDARQEAGASEETDLAASRMHDPGVIEPTPAPPADQPTPPTAGAQAPLDLTAPPAPKQEVCDFCGADLGAVDMQLLSERFAKKAYGNKKPCASCRDKITSGEIKISE